MAAQNKVLQSILRASARLIIFIALLAVVQESLRLYIVRLFKQQIQEKIPAEYLLDFQKVRVNWWEQTLVVKGLNITPKSEYTNLPNSLQLDLPALSVQITSLYKAVWNRELVFTKIEAEKPNIRLEKLPREGDNFTTSSFQLLNRIGQYLDVLAIDDLKVNNARLEHITQKQDQSQRILFEDIDLEISGFSLDSTMMRHSFLNARNVHLQIQGQQLYLPENDHLISFDTFQLSTDQRHIIFSGLEIRPLDSLRKNQDLLAVKAPKLYLQDINFEVSYLDKQLQIGLLDIQQPSIHFVNQVVDSLDGESGFNTLKSTISQFSTSLAIDKIRLTEAEIDLDLQQETETDEVGFDIDSILIYNFMADSSTSFKDIDHLPFQDIRFSLSNISQYVNQRVGKVTIQNAQLNSQAQSIELTELHIGSDEHTKTDFFHRSPKIKLIGIDIFDVLLRGRAKVEAIDLHQPYTHIQSFAQQQQTDHPDRDFYQTVGSFFKDFFIREINTQDFIVREGQLEIDHFLQIQEYNYWGRYIHLNESANNWTGIVPLFQLQLSDFSVRPDSTLMISGDSLFLNSQKSKFFNLELHKADSTSDIAIRIPLVRLEKPKVDSLFLGKFLADSLYIDDPEILISGSSALVKDSSSLDLPIQISWILINRGQLNYQIEDHDQLQVEEFDLVLNLVDSLQVLYSQFEHFSWQAPSFGHQIFIQKGRQLDDGFSYELDSISLIPIPGMPQRDSSMLIPNLRLYDWKIPEWKRSRQFQIRKVIAERPSAHFHLPDTFVKKDSIKNRRAIKMDTLLIFNARLSADQLDSDLYFQLPSVTLAVYDLDTKGKKVWSEKYAELLLGLDKGLDLRTNHYALSTSPLFFNSQGNRIQTDSAYFETRDSSRHITASLQKLEARDWNLDQWLNEKQWQFSALSIGSGHLTYSADSLVSGDTFSPQKLPNIQSALVRLNDFDISLHLKKDIQIQDWNLQINGLQLDSTFDKTHLSRNYQALKTSVKKVDLDLDKNRYYHLSFGSEFDSKLAKWQFMDIQLQKNLSNEKFAERHPYRTDYWSIRADQIQLDHFRPDQLFEEELHLAHISLNRLVAQDFNDETIPLKEDYRPLFPEKIKKIPYPFMVDSISVDGELSYRAIAPLTRDSSSISFHEIKGNIYHLTNIPKYFDRPLRMDVSALLYHQAPLEVSMNFQLDHSPATFEVSGNLTNFDLTQLNPVLRPEAAMAVNKGFSSKMLFNWAANDTVAVGDLLFRYKNLRVQLLDKEDISKSGFGNAVLSFWTNQIIQSRNPSLLRRRKGTIFFKRDVQKAIPHYWAHSILSGVVNSIGVKNTKRKLRKSHLNIDSFSYETLLKEQLKSGKDNEDQKDNL